MRAVLLLLPILLASLQCTSAPSLTEDEMNKLDPALRWLVEHDGEMEGPFHYVTSQREDGTTTFAVILRSDDPQALREAGLPIDSAIGPIVTARLNLEEVKQAARMDEVTAIRNSEMDPLPRPPTDPTA